MGHDEYTDLLHKGISAAEKGFIPSAQAYLDQAAQINNSPAVLSYQAYCLAKGQGRIQAAVQLCRDALDRDPHNSLHYLIMGRILLLSGHREKAIRTFRQGLRTSPNPKIIVELKKLGLRKPAIFQNLDRGHLLNRSLGKLFSKLGLR